MPSVPLKPVCGVADGPPCDCLLDDAEGVLTDPDRWPDHFGCPAVERWSTRRWAETRARNIYGYGEDLPVPVRDWITTWPLPVSPPLFKRPPIPYGLYPFPGPLWSMQASLILEPEIPFADVASFGTVVTIDDTLWPDPMLFTFAGHPTDRVLRFTTAAKRWWQGDNATGRPPGSGMSEARLLEVTATLWEHMGKAPSQDQVAAKVGINPRTLRNSLTRGWPAFLDYADAIRAHRQEVRRWSELSARGGTGKKPD